MYIIIYHYIKLIERVHNDIESVVFNLMGNVMRE